LASAPKQDALGIRIQNSFRAGLISRMPGRSDGVPINSIPADSSAVFTSISVEERLGGTPSTSSNRAIVFCATFAISASVAADHRKAARDARICAPVIIDNSKKVSKKDVRDQEKDI